jgi:glycosyltransferase involved in cell wall biosynthesis
MIIKQPFFSVIVPEHNSAEFMRKGLESIKSQTFTDYELIVVCDSEKERKIALEYTDTAYLIDGQLCSQKRNFGLDMAHGKWILFMDDDDWFMDSMVFQTIADAVGKEDEQILAFGFYWKGHGVHINKPGQLYTAVWNKCWKRSFIERINARFPDWEHSDDDGFSRRTHYLAKKISYLNQCLYFYNFMREGSLTWKIENGMIDGTIPKEV